MSDSASVGVSSEQTVTALKYRDWLSMRAQSISIHVRIWGRIRRRSGLRLLVLPAVDLAAADGPVDALWFKHEAMVLSGTDSALSLIHI